MAAPVAKAAAEVNVVMVGILWFAVVMGGGKGSGLAGSGRRRRELASSPCSSRTGCASVVSSELICLRSRMVSRCSELVSMLRMPPSQPVEMPRRGLPLGSAELFFRPHQRQRGVAVA